MTDLFSSAEIYESDDPDRIVAIPANMLEAGWQVLTQPLGGGGVQWIGVKAVGSIDPDRRKFMLVLDDPTGERTSVLPFDWIVTARPGE